MFSRCIFGQGKLICLAHFEHLKNYGEMLSVDDIYTQVLGPERHGRVRSLGFGATLTSVFGVTKKETNAALASKLKETQEREEQMQQQIQQQQG